MKVFQLVFRVCAVALFIGCISNMAVAQELTEGAKEVGGYVGIFEDSATIGGTFYVAMRPRVQIGGELGYITGPGGSATSTAGSFSAGSHAIEFSGNVHYLIPLQSYPKLTPYVLGGLGVTHATASASSTGPGGSASVSASDNSFGLNIGGGARWQIKDRWGIVPELKFLISDNSAVRFTVGIYYQLGK